VRTIKKYPNRRLYDTRESRYITLADIKQLVIDKEEFTVIDKKTGTDITRPILMQVISEQEQHGDPVMSRDFLSQIIRSYQNAMPGVVSQYLDQSLRLFVNQQAQVRSQIKKFVGVDPVEIVTNAAQRNFNRWKAMQEEVFKALGQRPDDSRQDSDGEGKSGKS
jgi:polyhydroxyalkanoate synthesis repressor PhaR